MSHPPKNTNRQPRGRSRQSRPCHCQSLRSQRLDISALHSHGCQLAIMIPLRRTLSLKLASNPHRDHGPIQAPHNHLTLSPSTIPPSHDPTKPSHHIWQTSNVTASHSQATNKRYLNTHPLLLVNFPSIYSIHYPPLRPPRPLNRNKPDTAQNINNEANKGKPGSQCHPSSLNTASLPDNSHPSKKEERNSKLHRFVSNSNFNILSPPPPMATN